MRRFGSWLKRELKKLFPIWLFFFLTFGMLRLTQTAVLAEFGIERTSRSLVFVGSMIVAKVFLIADRFRFVNRFQGKPLIVGTLWKTAIYFIGCFVFQVLDRVIHQLRQQAPVAEIGGKLLAILSTPRFLVVQLWLVILLLAFSATRELIAALGKDRIVALFFGTGKPVRGSKTAGSKAA